MARKQTPEQLFAAKQQAEAVEAAFRKTIVNRLWALQRTAKAVHAEVLIELVEAGFVVTFRFEDGLETSLNTFDSEQWEFEHLVQGLNARLDEQVAR